MFLHFIIFNVLLVITACILYYVDLYKKTDGTGTGIGVQNDNEAIIKLNIDCLKKH